MESKKTPAETVRILMAQPVAIEIQITSQAGQPATIELQRLLETWRCSPRNGGQPAVELSYAEVGNRLGRSVLTWTCSAGCQDVYVIDGNVPITSPDGRCVSSAQWLAREAVLCSVRNVVRHGLERLGFVSCHGVNCRQPRSGRSVFVRPGGLGGENCGALCTDCRRRGVCHQCLVCPSIVCSAAAGVDLDTVCHVCERSLCLACQPSSGSRDDDCVFDCSMCKQSVCVDHVVKSCACCRHHHRPCDVCQTALVCRKGCGTVVRWRHRGREWDSEWEEDMEFDVCRDPLQLVCAAPACAQRLTCSQCGKSKRYCMPCARCDLGGCADCVVECGQCREYICLRDTCWVELIAYDVHTARRGLCVHCHGCLRALLGGCLKNIAGVECLILLYCAQLLDVAWTKYEGPGY